MYYFSDLGRDMEKIQSEKPKPNRYNFTPREKDVLPLLVDGIQNDEIAEILCIEQATVKAHLTNIYKKLGVKNRTQAVRKIIDEKLIPRRDSEQP